MAEHKVGPCIDNSAGKQGQVTALLTKEKLGLFRDVLERHTFGASVK
jgi:hypothetical protein